MSKGIEKRRGEERRGEERRGEERRGEERRGEERRGGQDKKKETINKKQVGYVAVGGEKGVSRSAEEMAPVPGRWIRPGQVKHLLSC